MRRAGISLGAIAGTLLGAVAGAGQFGGGAVHNREDKEDSRLVQINVMRQEETPLGRFEIVVGDWIELYATAPILPENQERPFEFEIEIQGEATEKVAAVQLVTGGRHIFLRGKTTGQATLKTTVSRGDTWKESRKFEITVKDRAIAAIEKLGGIVSRIEDARDTPAIKVSFTSFGGMGGMGMGGGSPEITDAGLAHLEGLKGLQELDLSSDNITDAGLAHLEGLKGLRTLRLGSNNITDAGLERFRRALPQAEINPVQQGGLPLTGGRIALLRWS